MARPPSRFERLVERRTRPSGPASRGGPRLLADRPSGHGRLVGIQEPGVEEPLGDDAMPRRRTSRGRVGPPRRMSASSGVLRETRSNSSIVSFTPASLAMASRCRTALWSRPRHHAGDRVVQRLPGDDLTRQDALAQERSITIRPVSKATSSLRGSTARHAVETPMGETPSISNAVDMVLAVNCPPHAPAPGQARPSTSLSSARVDLARVDAPIASKLPGS